MVSVESCQVPSEVYGITRECYGEYSINKDDENDYTSGWQNITTYYMRIRWDNMMWRYQNASALDGYPVWARLNTYSGGGYVLHIYHSSEHAGSSLFVSAVVITSSVCWCLARPHTSPEMVCDWRAKRRSRNYTPIADDRSYWS